MSRSFGVVEAKVREADFFLTKYMECGDPSGEGQFYLSAFITAARSISFAMQSSLSDVEGFEEWYEVIKKELGADELASFFLKARNLSQKVGYYPVGHPEPFIDENGKRGFRWFFKDDVKLKNIPKTDVASASLEYFKTLLRVAQRCYKKFGPHIDSNARYTPEGLKALGMTVEDAEEECGYHRGYTAILGTDEVRIRSLYEEYFHYGIDKITDKYFGEDRFGDKLNSK